MAGVTTSGDNLKGRRRCSSWARIVASNEGGEARTSNWVKARRFGAGLTVLVGTTLYVASYYVSGLEVCRGRLPVCDAWTLAELVPFAMITLGLLAPDLNEIGVPGLVSLKRRVEGQEARVEMQRERHELLSTQIANLQSSASAQASASPTINVHLPNVPHGVEKIRDNLADKTAGVPARERKGDEPGEADESNLQRLTKALIDAWAELETWIWPALPRPPGRKKAYRPGIAGEVALWATQYRQEIESLRGARNDVAHPPVEASTTELAAALDIGERLLKLVQFAFARDVD